MIYLLRLIAMFAVWCIFGAILGILIFLPLKLSVLGAVLGFLVGAGYSGFAYHGAEQSVLEIYEAELLDSARAPFLYNMLERICHRARVDPPVLYLIPTPAVNAFVVARAERSAAVGLTTGLLKNLPEDELRAVLALMVARVSDQNIIPASVGAALGGLPIRWLSSEAATKRFGGLFAPGPENGLTAPQRLGLSIIMPACLATLRISIDSQRISEADLKAAQWTSPQAVAAALLKIEGFLPKTWWESAGFNAATALLFAVPPLLKYDALPANSPYCVRAQSSFPFNRPNPVDRGRRLIGNAEIREIPYEPGSFDYFLGIETPPPVQR